jgi:hypothetical protein
VPALTLRVGARRPSTVHVMVMTVVAMMMVVMARGPRVGGHGEHRQHGGHG